MHTKPTPRTCRPSSVRALRPCGLRVATDAHIHHSCRRGGAAHECPRLRCTSHCRLLTSDPDAFQVGQDTEQGAGRVPRRASVATRFTLEGRVELRQGRAHPPAAQRPGAAAGRPCPPRRPARRACAVLPRRPPRQRSAAWLPRRARAPRARRPPAPRPPAARRDASMQWLMLPPA